MRQSRLWLLRAALSTACLGILCCRLTFPRGCPGAASSKDDAGLRLCLSTDSRTYRRGQVILLKLSFTSSIPDRYEINLARYDRSGRMNYEQFLLYPKEGTSDPLQLYFSSIGGYLGGGLTSFKFLSTSPTVIPLDLNEWVRFDRPGTYRLAVVSCRVSDTRAGGSRCVKALDLKSNAITLQITTPDAGWQRAQVATIRETLSGAEPLAADARNGTREDALKALRYLGTIEAARELAKRLRGEAGNADWDCMFGLIGSPYRRAALKEMDALFKDPQFPVCDLFLTTMSILPLSPAEASEYLRNQRVENLKTLRRRLILILPHKRGRAFGISLDTALSGVNPQIPPKLLAGLMPELIEIFPTLPVDKQISWLQYRWREVKSAKWLPLLRSLARQYEDFPEPLTMPSYESLRLTAVALTRWYELDPKGARGAVLAEIIRPKPRYDAHVLGLLPDKTLPQEEHVIARHFLATRNYEIEGNLASLLFRYANAAVLPDVLPKVQSQVGAWACVPQNEILAYVLKVDPQTAEPLIERAIKARGPRSNACRHMVFTDIGALQTSSVLERLAVRSLNDPDLQVAGNAAVYLGEYGTADAEQALWTRYEAWSREWTGRAMELCFIAGGKNPYVWDAGLGQSLAHALATGTGWLSGEATLHRIEKLGVDAEIKLETERDLRAWLKRPFTITYIASVPPRLTVAQYDLPSLNSLEKKLTQFPRRTKFLLFHPTPGASPLEQKTREKLLEFARKNGITMNSGP